MTRVPEQLLVHLPSLLRVDNSGNWLVLVEPSER